jgi:diacylglycerol kinase family enzyme
MGEIGSFFDPLSDKFLVIGLFSFFWYSDKFSIIFLFLFILRDILVNSIRWIAARQELIVESNKYNSSMKIFQHLVLVLLILMELINFKVFDSLLLILITTAVILAILSTISFSKQYGKQLRARIRAGKKFDDRKMIILANKKSRGYHDGYRRMLLRIFARRRKLPIYYLKKGNDLFRILEDKIKGVKNIIIAGGDGSFEAALNNPLFAKKNLGFFPFGAGNAFYSHFYKGKGMEYLRKKFRFRRTKLDILELSWDGGKVQTLFAGIGIDAEVMRLSRNRTESGFRDYFKAGFKVAVGSKANYNLKLKVDKKEIHWPNCANLILAKIAYLGYGIRSLFYVRPTDNFVYGMGVVNRHSPFFNKFLRLWSLLLGHLGIDKPPLVKLRGKKIIITSEIPFPIQAGGDFLGFTQKLEVKVKRKQNVLVI